MVFFFLICNFLTFFYYFKAELSYSNAIEHQRLPNKQYSKQTTIATPAQPLTTTAFSHVQNLQTPVQTLAPRRSNLPLNLQANKHQTVTTVRSHLPHTQKTTPSMHQAEHPFMNNKPHHKNHEFTNQKYNHNNEFKAAGHNAPKSHHHKEYVPHSHHKQHFNKNLHEEHRRW